MDMVNSNHFHSYKVFFIIIFSINRLSDVGQDEAGLHNCAAFGKNRCMNQTSLREHCLHFLRHVSHGAGGL